MLPEKARTRTRGVTTSAIRRSIGHLAFALDLDHWSVILPVVMRSQAERASPRERYREVLRREILDAAREAFGRYGYEGVSMRQLAEKVGCSHSNLYLHFKDKDALFDCLVEESFDQFAEGLRKVPESVRRGNPVEFLRKAGRAY